MRPADWALSGADFTDPTMPAEIDVTLWLKPPPAAGFTAEAAIALGAQPVLERAYVSRADLRSSGDAVAAIRDAVAASFAVAGISKVEHAWRRVRIRGTSAACNAAVDALLATPFASAISAVFGLVATAATQSAAHVGTAERADWLTARAVAHAYRMPAGLTGSGVTIGILYFSGTFHDADFRLAMAEAQVRPPRCVLRGEGDTATPEDDVEIALDTQIAGALAPEATLVLYRGNNDASGYAETVADALLDDENAPSILTISYGLPESAWFPEALEVIDQLFIDAALCGITVIAASGDRGSDVVLDQARVTFPASSRFVLACGGTNLRLEDGRRVSETVWQEPGRASGGGYSRTFAQPAWHAAGANRGLPDVAGHAATAAGYKTYVGGRPQAVGGTSAVAPLWAAFFALVGQRLGRSCGFVSPLLYGATDGLFYDITTGGNGRYSAIPGWDPCTGLGSPHFGKLLRFFTGARIAR